MVVSNTGSILIGIGVCVLAAAFSALVFFAIPTMLVGANTLRLADVGSQWACPAGIANSR